MSFSAQQTAFAQGLNIVMALADSLAYDSSPRSHSDVTTPRTWSVPPSRAASIEPVPAAEQPDVVGDVRCTRDQTRRKGRFSCSQIPDVMPANRWD